ncbi:copper homeostasis membrane protein CopD [Sphingomonas sp. MAH-20]|jgi:putative copper resistance protein D|uniref:Copper homeostasis membrane protein CopD n=1 Tax=Sphingomonas horti TaxID=2682842 RepID=A0A6I4J7A5_9SPHN|nr:MULTISPECIES: copper homeostasis membrane protein CopD [Sphingomonas]MBA2918760.1 copper homeostasis membrane protein CopD [Sphingomonas sp. CGMCC 1.13658]MVO78791.1 copper homeostasis membrane protein CopD [Sphingomonas horti]
MADTPMIMLRFALYADLALVFGVPLFGLYALRAPERRRLVAPLWPWAAGAALLGALLSALGVAMLAASMAGVSLAEVDRASIDAILWQTSIGSAAILRICALIAAALLAPLIGRFPKLGLSAVAFGGGVALSLLAWTGHGAMDEGTAGWIHLAADIVHLLAAGAWIGAILGLALLLVGPRVRFDDAHLLLSHHALEGFAMTGTIVVTLLVLTGIVNSWILVGPDRVLALPASLYGQLLIAKLVVFSAMLGLAAANRFCLTPRLAGQLGGARHGTAVGALRRSLLIEVTLGFVILAIVAWLGMVEPPAS